MFKEFKSYRFEDSELREIMNKKFPSLSEL